MPAIALAVLAQCGSLVSADDDAARGALVKPRADVAGIQAALSAGQFTPRAVALTPCFPDQPVGYARARPVRNLWAGRFRVEQGAPGWSLVVRAKDGTQAWRKALPVQRELVPWQSGVISSTTGVVVSLEGPGTAAATCPLVYFESELTMNVSGQARGMVGDDDRWNESDPRLSALRDASTVRSWGAGVVHMATVTATGYLMPCTAFFVGPHTLVTAFHCVGSPQDADAAIVYLGDLEIRAPRVKLLIAQGDLDFSIIHVTTDPPSTVLAVGDDVEGPLVLWQHPDRATRKISLVGCVTERIQGVRAGHQCDTEGGTSGSPVQSRTSGSVIAVHTLGCTQSSGSASCVNYGVRVHEIRERVLSLAAALRAMHPQEADEVLAAFRRAR